MEIRYLPNEEFKIRAVKMLTEVRKTKHEQRISTKGQKIFKKY